jgi:hypothetical protein
MSGTFISPRLRPSLLSAEPIDYICNACSRRSVATYRRTRKALKVVGAQKSGSTTEREDHIIFNPPSSAPNVYHTPYKFLPSTDKRKALLARHMATTSGLSSPPTSSSLSSPQSTLAAIAAARRQQSAASLPQPLKPVKEKRYHLGQAEVDEMRRLRAENTRAWPLQKLAEKFDCSVYFATLCCYGIGDKDLFAERAHEMAAVKSRWGRKRTEAREDRAERKTLWGAV